VRVKLIWVAGEKKYRAGSLHMCNGVECLSNVSIASPVTLAQLGDTFGNTALAIVNSEIRNHVT